MPLEFLAIMVAIGLALVIGAVHFSGLSRPARLADADQARARFLLDYPDEAIGEIVLGRDGNAAFISLSAGRIGLVHAMGDRFVTRILERRVVRAVEPDGSGALVLKLDDFTLPKERAVFTNSADAAKVSHWLNGAEHA
ncbi:MAG TPA: hypothetical protein VLQ68_11385 [Rhizobiaceae bacterium]|nr:hypothetical protein [Rhizobiaceae bacterium]